jgi:ABC-type cobalamin transport system permease subunit
MSTPGELFSVIQGEDWKASIHRARTTPNLVSQQLRIARGFPADLTFSVTIQVNGTTITASFVNDLLVHDVLGCEAGWAYTTCRMYWNRLRVVVKLS